MRRLTLVGLSAASLAAALVLGCGGGGYGGGGGTYGGTGGGGGGTGNIITSITISPSNASIAMGGSQQFTAVAKDSMGNTVSGAQLNWKSSNTAVATVDSSGLATAKAAGTTGITASVTYSGGAYGNGVTYTSNTATLAVTLADAVMGTAATGHALAGALVTIEDNHGHTASAVSGADGRFLVSTAGMQAPFLLRADDGRGRVLFGAAAGDGVANITTVTDLMLRAWYGSRGATPEIAFAGTPAAPGAKSLATLDKAFGALLHDALASQGLDTKSFSLLSTPFDADGNGFDKVLDNTAAMTGAHLRLHDGLGARSTEIGVERGTLHFTTRTAGVQATETKQIELP